ncbi:YceI family protein [Pedobacter sp. Du54]|uniref:YceI family protein n=1 Tax=Pedobacter anseongensis TaxID=3133439 RepID=UPI003097E364
MKTLMIILMASMLTSFDNVRHHPVFGKSSKWVISKSSSLAVNGSTNVNRFSCAIVQYPKTDTVRSSQDQKNVFSLSGEINIEVKNFNCNNSLMTQELRKTLKETQFPTLQVRFLSLKATPASIQSRDFARGLVEIEIAGIAKRFEIDYQLSFDKNTMYFTGCQLINFSDFKLEPPKKMGKLIQAKDQLKVVFFLKMEEAS